MRKIYTLFTILLIAHFSKVAAQPVLVMRSGTVTTCDTTFTDSGGSNAGYRANENFTLTICSGDIYRNHISLGFDLLDLAVGDELCFYDGNSTNAPLLACSSDFSKTENAIVQTTATNPSGCMTIRFRSDGSNQRTGWVANVICIPSCQTIKAAITATNPLVLPIDTGWIDACPNKTRVSFKAKGTYPQNGFAYTQTDALNSFEWNFGDGTPVGKGPEVDHIFENAGGYIVRLTITDTLGCQNINYVKQRVRVSPRPTFNIGNIPSQVCAGTEIKVRGKTNVKDNTYQVSTQQNQGSFQTGGVRSGRLFIPDNGRNEYRTSITFSDFGPGQMLSNISDLLDIFVNMEHSWARDLEIKIVCPSNKQAILHKYDTRTRLNNRIRIGTPNTIDFSGVGINDSSLNRPGTGQRYDWVPTGATYTWRNRVVTGDYNLPPGKYQSEDPLTNLLGCPLNGQWSLVVKDQFSMDNGWIFSWGIDFNKSLYPALESFTPQITDHYWVKNDYITTVYDKDSMTVRPKNAGTASLTYLVKDNFGCTFDTSIKVQVLPPTALACLACDLNTKFTKMKDTVICTTSGGVVLNPKFNGTLTPSVTFDAFPDKEIEFLTFPPSAPFVSNMPVSSIVPATITNPTTQIDSVCFDIKTFVSADMIVDLKSPSGQTIRLYDRRGGIGSDFIRNVCFSPKATKDIATAAPNLITGFSNGLYQPEGGSTTWNTLIGSTITGNWQLFVADAAGINKDTLTRWSITFVNQNGLKYSWTPAKDLTCTTCPNPKANPSVTTTYRVNVTDSLNCTYVDSVRVIVLDSLDAPLVSVSNLNFNLIIFDWQPVNGATGYEVSVNGGAWMTPSGPLSHAVTGLKIGDVVNLRVRAISAGTCGAKIGSITQETLKCTATVGNGSNRRVEVDSIRCFGLASPKVNLAFANGVAPLVIKIDNLTPNNGAFFDDIIFAGRHVAYVSDSTGCTDSLVFTLGQPPVLKLDLTPTDIKCDGVLNGKITAAASGGVGGYIYRNVTNFLEEFRSLNVFDTLDLGQYVIELQDKNACSVTDTIVIMAPPAFSVTPMYSSISCFGEKTGSIMAEGSGGVQPYTWQWNNLETTETIDSLGAGQYNFTITDFNGCQIQDSVTLNDELKIELVTDQLPSLCYDDPSGQASVIATGGNAPYTFLWSNPFVGDVNAGIKAGTYRVSVSDSYGCLDTASVVVSQPDSIRFDSLVAIKATCFNTPTGRAYALVSGGTSPYEYLWNPTNDVNPSVSNLIPGKYTVKITDANGCVKTGEVVVGSENELKVDKFSLITPIKCNGDVNGELSAIASGGVGSLVYEWNTSPIQRGQTASNLAAGTYSVRVDDGNGCTAILDTTLTEPLVLQANIASFTNVKCKGGSDGTATPSVLGGTPFSTGIRYSYRWSDANAQTVPTAVGLGIGAYRLTVTDANNCTTTANVNITEPATSVTTTIRQTKLGCFGQATGTAAVTAAGGVGSYTYLWSNLQKTPSVTTLAKQKYYVTVKDGNDCPALDSIDVNTLDSIAIRATAIDPRCNNGKDGSLTVNTVTGGAGNGALNNYAYRWNTSPIQTTAQATQVVGNKLYTVLVRDNEGCENALNLFVNNPNPILLTSSFTNVSCNNGNDGIARVDVVGSKAPFTYQWSSNANGQTSPIANNLSAGRYRITVRDSSNCSVDTSITIDQPKAMLISSQKIADAKCVGDSVGRIEITIAGGTPQYKYLWSNNDTSRIIEKLRAGAYNLVVTDAKGCQIQESFSVKTPGGLDGDVTATPVKCFGEPTGTITVEAFGGTQPYQYSNNGKTFNGINKFVSIRAGKYDVFIKDANNCAWFEQIEVTQPAKFIIEAMPDVTITLGDSVRLFANVLNSRGEVSLTWRQPYEGTLSCVKCPTPMSKPLHTIIYSAYGVDSAGCRALDSVTVNVVKPRFVFVPTGFTPNGDFVNDRLTIRGKEGTKIITFKVYDRWGELLYEAQDFKINNDDFGWDGKFKGETMTSGMYVWYMEVEYIDKEKEIIKGNTSLIR